MKSRLIATALFLLTTTQTLFAAQPLVDAEWLVANLQQPNLRIVDLQPASGYQQIHITGAVHSDYSRWRQRDKQGIPGMMPNVATLEQMIGKLGINNQTHVVLVPFGRGAGDLAAASRVYWTLKTVGHDEVSILNGGLTGYAENRDNPLESSPNTPAATSFKANLRKEYLVSTAEVKAAIDSDTTLFDSRSIAEFEGRRGKPGRSGTIPTSVNLSFEKLVMNGSAYFYKPHKIKKIFNDHQVPLEGALITYCHTGHRAALTWFVSHELLGNSKTQLYDGSMAEWAADSTLPLK